MKELVPDSVSVPAPSLSSAPLPLIEPDSVVLPELEMRAAPPSSMVLLSSSGFAPRSASSAVDSSSTPITTLCDSQLLRSMARRPASMMVSPASVLVPEPVRRTSALPRFTRSPAPWRVASTVAALPSMSSTTDSLALRVVLVTLKLPSDFSVTEPPLAEMLDPDTVMLPAEFRVAEPPLAETVTPDAVRPPTAWTLVDPPRLLIVTFPDRLTPTPGAELPAEAGSPSAANWAAP